MLRLRVKAPFAAFRPFTAGHYRPTAPFLTPSAAYGLLLNAAAIETRHDDGKSPMTLMAENLPSAEIAIGAVCLPEVQSLYQQLHNYPVGATGKKRAPETKGNKYNIQPIRRQFLSDLDAYLCLRGNDWLEARVRDGLRLGSWFAPEGKRRYGVPFLGDNNFIISVLREETDPVPSYWFMQIGRDMGGASPNICRLTVWIDRRDMSRTATRLYRRMDEATLDPPADAWTSIPPREASP